MSARPVHRIGPGHAWLMAAAVLAAGPAATGAPARSASPVPEAQQGAAPAASPGAGGRREVSAAASPTGAGAQALLARRGDPGVWVTVQRGPLHLIQADLAAASWSDRGVAIPLLAYQRQGLLGPQANAHFRLELAEVTCAGRTRAASSSVLFGPDLAVMESGAGLLSAPGGEPQTVWEQTVESLCGLFAPTGRVRVVLPAELRPLQRERDRLAALGGGPLADFVALETRVRGLGRVPVLHALGDFYRAEDGDCGVRPDGIAVQVRGGQWDTAVGACPMTGFDNEVRLLALIRADSAGSLQAAIDRALQSRPPLRAPLD